MENLNFPKLSKGEKTRELAIQSAIYCLANLGYDQTTFQAIADRSKLSQPLVVHYFKKKENVFPMVIEYLVKLSQNVRYESEFSATQDLKDYLKAALAIFRLAPNSARVYFTLSYLAVFKKDYKLSHAQIKKSNIARLADIIAKGIERKEFSSGAIMLKAQSINNFLAGTFVDLMIEDNPSSDQEVLDLLSKACLAILTTSETK